MLNCSTNSGPAEFTVYNAINVQLLTTLPRRPAHSRLSTLRNTLRPFAGDLIARDERILVNAGVADASGSDLIYIKLTNLTPVLVEIDRFYNTRDDHWYSFTDAVVRGWIARAASQRVTVLNVRERTWLSIEEASEQRIVELVPVSTGSESGEATTETSIESDFQTRTYCSVYKVTGIRREERGRSTTLSINEAEEAGLFDSRTGAVAELNSTIVSRFDQTRSTKWIPFVDALRCGCIDMHFLGYLVGDHELNTDSASDASLHIENHLIHFEDVMEYEESLQREHLTWRRQGNARHPPRPEQQSRRQRHHRSRGSLAHHRRDFSAPDLRQYEEISYERRTVSRQYIHRSDNMLDFSSHSSSR